MATARIQSQAPSGLSVGSILSSGPIQTTFQGADTTQVYPSIQTHVVSGSAFETIGGDGGGLVDNRKYASVSPFVSGRSYIQWGLAQSLVAPFDVYTKITAGTQTLTDDPSTDAVNWALVSAGTGSSLFNAEMIESHLSLQGDTPTTLSWLGEGFGTAMVLTGRPSNGSSVSDASLRVSGPITTEGLIISNVNHLEDPSCSPSGTYCAIGTDYFYPLGVQTPTPVGGPRPTKYGGGVWLAYTPGASRIYTTASSTGAVLFTQRDNISVVATGAVDLYVPAGNRQTGEFEVVAFDTSTGLLAPNDTSTFQWLIVNPSW